MMNQSRFLRLALLMNGIFSGFSGLALTFQVGQISDWIGFSYHSMVLTGIGFGLMLFSIELFIQASQKRMQTWRSLLASFSDFLWLVATLVVLFFFPNLFNATGHTTIIGICTIVLFLGLMQIIGINRYHKVGGSNFYRHCLQIESFLDPKTLWTIIGDLGEIQKYMPSLKESKILENKNSEIGCIRQCTDIQGNSWSEECISYNSDQSFQVKFLTKEEGFPFPAQEMIGGWEIQPTKNNASIVKIWWELVPNNPKLSWLLLPILGMKADKDFQKIIRNMELSTIDIKNKRKIVNKNRLKGKLLPTFC
ncbi:MAG: hypothetical protein GW761_11480 [Leptospira sp.]|nr:hypothetical protein [Leptospira sp.]